MLDTPIYLDHHATTPLDPRVLAVMLPLWSEPLGNPSSPHHAPARRAAAAIEAARREAAALLRVRQGEICFTSGATESNNFALLGVMRSSPRGSHLVISAIEHSSVHEPAMRLCREGYGLTIVPVDAQGLVEVQAVADALTPQTVLVSIMTANNEIGTVQPIAEIAALCRSREVLFHTDAVQAASCLPLPFDDWPVDLVSLSAHKLYGPLGVGALLVRRHQPRIRLQPLTFGGSQEYLERAGTLPTPLIAGFGVACRLVQESLATEPVRLAALRDRLWSRLQAQCDGLTLNGHPTLRLPSNLHFSVDGVDGDALLTAITDVAVSSGAACSAREHQLSPVLRAIGLDDRRSRSSLRIGIGRFNTPEEIDRAADYIAGVVRRLRAARVTRNAKS